MAHYWIWFMRFHIHKEWISLIGDVYKENFHFFETQDLDLSGSLNLSARIEVEQANSNFQTSWGANFPDPNLILSSSNILSSNRNRDLTWSGSVPPSRSTILGIDVYMHAIYEEVEPLRRSTRISVP